MFCSIRYKVGKCTNHTALLPYNLFESHCGVFLRQSKEVLPCVEKHWPYMLVVLAVTNRRKDFGSGRRIPHHLTGPSTDSSFSLTRFLLASVCDRILLRCLFKLLTAPVWTQHSKNPGVEYSVLGENRSEGLSESA